MNTGTNGGSQFRLSPGNYVEPNDFILIPSALTICSVIRRYEFTISRKTIAPDGYQKKSILINGQFPGPLIEANW